MGLLEGLIGYLGPWSWLLLALLLAGIEVVVPGTFFIWFGAAALVVGLLALAVTLSWQVESVLFVLLSAAAVLIGRRFYGRASSARDLRLKLGRDASPLPDSWRCGLSCPQKPAAFWASSLTAR
ncbi:MAG: ybbJ [Proteobacteria bacterium]|nr:ybbJ [Pseudomonadota bacterium]